MLRSNKKKNLYVGGRNSKERLTCIFEMELKVIFLTQNRWKWKV